MTYIERPKQDITDITIIPPDSQAAKLAAVLGMSLEYVSLVRDVTAKGATDAEFCLFLQIVHDTGLNPLQKEIFFYKRWDGQAGKELPIIHASIQGKRKAAERIGGYCPGRETELKYDDNGNLFSATAYVKRKVSGDWQEIAFTAYWDEFAQYKKDGKTLASKWATMGRHMLAKCAENHALNRAFPTLENIASTENLSTESFNAAFDAPAPQVDPEAEHRRRVLIDGLTDMGKILLDEESLNTLLAWLETAPVESLATKHSNALGQFLLYAQGVYNNIPEEDRKAALESFNVEDFGDLRYEELLRFCLTYQKPIGEQDQPANVEVPPPPAREARKPREGRPKK